MRYLLIAISFIGLAVSCGNKKNVPPDPDVYYTCSMDPQVIAYKPGKCPICKMELTPVKKNNAENKDDIQLSEQQVQLGNIKMDTIQPGPIGDQLVLTATLTFDEMKTSSVSTRVMGRVEKLYHKNTGDFVKAGTPLFDLYSEELNNAIQEYRLALDRKKEFAGETAIDFEQLLRSAENKLLLWGLSKSQVEDMARLKSISPAVTFYSRASGYITSLEVKEGDYVMEGGTIVKLADLSRLWAEAQMYSSRLSEIDQDGIATVQFPDMDGMETKGRIEFVNPEISPDTRITLVRVSIPNPGLGLKPGMPAYVLLKSRPRKSLSLPVNAVIRNGEGAFVWLQKGPSTFTSRMVETGLESGDRIEITSGLMPGEVVVVSGAYLLNSEYIFRKGADPMAGHHH